MKSLVVLQRSIVAYGQRLTLACDGRCDKAWGSSSRPRKMFSDDPDDYVFEADQDLGEAPIDPGTTEGFQGKPSGVSLTDAALMNKWCFRECERSGEAPEGEAVKLPDMSSPAPNMPHRRAPAAGGVLVILPP